MDTCVRLYMLEWGNIVAWVKMLYAGATLLYLSMMRKESVNDFIPSSH